jgi:hypothetical protein
MDFFKARFYCSSEIGQLVHFAPRPPSFCLMVYITTQSQKKNAGKVVENLEMWRIICSFATAVTVTAVTKL